MRPNVITGGPGVGKTTLLERLCEKGYIFIPEVARFVISSGYQPGSKAFQERIARVQRQWEEKTSAIFCDRSMIDGIAYCNFFKTDLPRNLPDNLKNRYSRVFVLDPLQNYVNDEVRKESREESVALHDAIIQTYRNLGYSPIFVPAVDVESRVDLILSELEIERERKFVLYENGIWHCAPPNLENGVLVRQGYLDAPEGFSEMRIRQIGREFFQTKKNGNGEVRRELEEKISRLEFERLWPMTEGMRILKERFEWEGFEVDRYFDRDLIVAEAEFRNIQIGKEVTGDESYSNKNLAR